VVFVGWLLWVEPFLVAVVVVVWALEVDGAFPTVSVVWHTMVPWTLVQPAGALSANTLPDRDKSSIRARIKLVNVVLMLLLHRRTTRRTFTVRAGALPTSTTPITAIGGRTGIRQYRADRGHQEQDCQNETRELGSHDSS
jgi:hypothetical protein